MCISLLTIVSFLALGLLAFNSWKLTGNPWMSFGIPAALLAAELLGLFHTHRGKDTLPKFVRVSGIVNMVLWLASMAAVQLHR